MTSCDNCLYNKLCKGEASCVDYEPADMYAKFTWNIGDIGYIIFAGQIHKVKVLWVSYTRSSLGNREIVWYDFYGEELHYIVGDETSNTMYRNLKDAEVAFAERNK